MGDYTTESVAPTYKYINESGELDQTSGVYYYTRDNNAKKLTCSNPIFIFFMNKIANIGII